MVSAIKPVVRRAEEDAGTVLVDKSIGAVSPLEAELEAEIEEEENRGLSMLYRDTTEQQMARVVQMFDQVAELNSQLSPELCKEDHGGYMGLWARIERLCLCIQTRLVSLEHDVSSMEIPDVPIIVGLTGFLDRSRKIIHARAERVRKQESDKAVIRSWRNMVDTERGRPAKLHEEAVQHVKRLLMYDDPRYQQLPRTIADTTRAMQDESDSHGRTKRFELFKEMILQLQSQQPLLDKEFYDKALQKVQESDNGPRPA